MHVVQPSVAEVAWPCWQVWLEHAIAVPPAEKMPTAQLVQPSE